MTTGELTSLLTDTPWLFLLALGMYISLRGLRFPDLTVEGSFVLGMAGMYWGLHTSGSSLFGVFIAMLLGGLAGTCTALIYAAKPLPLVKILAGLLTGYSVYSVAFRLLGGADSVSLGNLGNHFFARLRSWDTHLGTTPWNPIANGAVWLFAALLGAACVAFLRSPRGAVLRAAGTNADYLSRLGIEPKWQVLIGLMIANATVGIAGAIWSGTNISAHATPVGALVDALGALLVGELAIRFLYRRNISSSPLAGVVACGLGAILYAFARILAYKVAKGTFADMQAQDQKLLVGLIILVIVLLIPKSESRGESRVL